jgi:tRNA dimethylallyltransferase
MALPARGRAILNAPAPGPALEWIGLAGPTACGKTALALALARRWPVEIVSVDSALVYRGMDIGTAKPSAAERAAVPHHLLDLVEPEGSYSAAQFVADARRLIAQIRARGRWPLLVGGTMMYFKALVDGLDALPPADPAIRAALDAEAAARGWPALHADLARVDPVTAARLAPNDSQRIQRALEVFRVAGVPLSALHGRRAGGAGDRRLPADGSLAAASSARVDGPRPTATRHRSEERASSQPAASRQAAVVPATAAAGGAATHALIALEPASRAWLHERVAQRFDAMLAAGFLDEVRTLRRRPGLHPDLPAIRCVGYRQAWEALDAHDPPDLAALRERGIAATRQLAKRQLTWLRSMPERMIVEADAPDVEARLLATVRALAGPPPA